MTEFSADLINASRILVTPGNVRVNVGGLFHFGGNFVQGNVAPTVITDGSMVDFQPVGSVGSMVKPYDLLAWWLHIVGGHVVNNADAKTVEITLNQRDQAASTVLLTLPITAATANFWFIIILLAFGGAGVIRVVGFGAQGPGAPTFVLPVVASVAVPDLQAGVALAVNASVGATIGDIIVDQRIDIGGGAGGIVAGQPGT